MLLALLSVLSAVAQFAEALMDDRPFPLLLLTIGISVINFVQAVNALLPRLRKRAKNGRNGSPKTPSR